MGLAAGVRVGRRNRLDVLVRRVAPWVAALLVLGAARGARAQSAPSESPDERLWTEITHLRSASESRPALERFAADRAQRQRLLDALRRYQRLYPGGPRAGEALRIELQTRFELASLDGGRLDSFCARIDEILKNPPGPAAEEEAAYWHILCERAARSARAPIPSSRPVDELDPDEAVLLRAYVDRYPGARFAPHVAERLVDDYLRRDAPEPALALLAVLQRAHPQDTRVERLSGRLARRTGIGQEFELRGSDLGGKPIDARDARGETLLVVVWSPLQESSLRTLAEIEAWRRGGAGRRVIGVLTEGPQAAVSAAAERLGLEWAQWLDPLGAASPFCRRWGVAQTPTVFVIDPSGRLRGVAEDAGWKSLAQAVAESKE